MSSFVDRLRGRTTEVSRRTLAILGLIALAVPMLASCGGGDGKKSDVTATYGAKEFNRQLEAIDETSQAGMQATAEFGKEQFHIQLTAQAAQKTPQP